MLCLTNNLVSDILCISVEDAMTVLTKTEQVLLNRAPMHGRIHLNGKRECDAAKKLVAAGLASRFENLSGLSKGEYYINPFTRRPGISRSIFVYGGYLYL